MQRRDFLASLAAGTFFSLLPASRAFSALPSNITDLDMIDTAALIRTGKASMLEVNRAAMDRIDALNPQINAVVTKSYAHAVRQIVAKPQGVLAGVPYLIKDLTAISGIPMTQGSRLFSSFVPQAQTPFTDRTLATGLIVLGKTNTPEFGLMATTEPIAYGATRNPWHLNHSAGGSSGGAAAAVAARMVPAAHASDGGGSIRFPAAACHLFGLKPSQGRFGGQGADARAVRLSIRHTISRTVRDSAFLLALTENGEGATLPPIGYIEAPSRKKRKIALSYQARNIGSASNPQEVTTVRADAEVRQKVDKVAKTLEALGHDIIIVKDTPHDDPRLGQITGKIWAGRGQQIMALAERMTGISPKESGLLERRTLGMIETFFDTGGIDYTDEIRAIVKDVKANYDRFMRPYDAWLTPISPIAPPPLGYFTDPQAGFETLIQRTSDFAAFTPLHNILSTAAASIPGGFSANGVPIGVQLAANVGEEAILLDLAYQLEQAMPWGDDKPRLIAA